MKDAAQKRSFIQYHRIAFKSLSALMCPSPSTVSETMETEVEVEIGIGVEADGDHAFGPICKPEEEYIGLCD